MYIINYSEETSKKNIFDEFNEFFMFFLKKDKLSENEDFLLRCCLALFQIYLDFLSIPENKIKKAWNEQIKPLICKKYPMKNDDTGNADVEFLIQEIDRINSKQNNTNNKQVNIEEKSLRKKRLNDIRMNTIYVSSKNFLNKGDIKNNNNINSKINNNSKQIKPIIKNKTLVNNIFNNKLKSIKSEIIINQNAPKKKEYLTLKIKKNEKLNIQSMLITMRKKFNLASKERKNKSIDDKENRKFTLIKSFNLNQYADEVYIKDNDDIHNKKKKTILAKKPILKITNISPNYIDEIDSVKTIRYNNNNKNKRLIAISFNYLLKQIVTTDYIEKDVNIQFIYGFCQQCFCFVKKENLFQKIINCYNYYKKLNTPFIHLKKLIYFLNFLTIEMVDFYHKPNTKLSLDKNLQKFYNILETDLAKTIDKNDKTEEIKEKVKDKKPMPKRASIEFLEKIRMLEELKLREQKNLMNKEETKKVDKKTNSKETINKAEEDIREKGEVLNEILNIYNLFNNNYQKYNFYFGVVKNNLKLYNYYKKVKFIKRKTTINTPLKINKDARKSLTKGEKKFYMNYFSILDYEPEDIGEALIAISKIELNKIERRELYCAIFLKKNKEKRCPNLTECITKFNKLTSFIMQDILSYDFPQIRAKVIYRWLKVAQYLKQRKDHNDCFAIFTALNHYTITGLKKTRKEMQLKATSLEKKIKEYCSFEGNYKNFREEIHNCVKKEEYFLPYLGLLLRDISFFEASYDYIIENNLINVEKIEKVQEIIDEFFYFKNIKDNYAYNYPDELNFFKGLENINEDDLEILANQLEPKFILSDIPQKFKRFTSLDIKYFQNRTFTSANVIIE